MANKDYDDISQLYKELEKEFKTVIRDVTIEKMKDIEAQSVEDNVYNAYSTTFYDRREGNGGLSDRDNMKPDVNYKNGNMTISIVNETKGNTAYKGATNGYISDYIEEGGHYWNNSLNEKIGARPFQEIAQETIDSTEIIETTIENALKNLGYDLI